MHAGSFMYKYVVSLVTLLVFLLMVFSKGSRLDFLYAPLSIIFIFLVLVNFFIYSIFVVHGNADKLKNRLPSKDGKLK